MIYREELIGKKVKLRALELEDCQQYYLDWLNDKEVNQYLETRWIEQDIEKIKDFVSSIRESNHSYIFAIIYGNQHVGNIKIGPIHPIYKHADVSYFIGEKSAWGHGVATEAISLITSFSFHVLGLNKIQAGVFEENIGSSKALLKNGYKLEGTFRKKTFVTKEKGYCDTFEYGILKDEYIQAF